MSAKTVFPCALVLALLGMAAARAQDVAAPPSGRDAYSAPTAGAGAGTGEAVPPPSGPVPGQLSTWITYPRPGCCGPLGDRPIATELFLRVGPSLPVKGEVFDGTLKTGWDIDGGGRVLFFNKVQDAAWIVDLSISNIYNQGRNPDLVFPTLFQVSNPNFNSNLPPDPAANPATIPIQQVTIHNLNRTFVNFGLGREWYWSLPAHAPQSKLRLGIDGGFRYGTARLELHETTHRTDNAYGAWVALSSDWEIPRGCCTFLVGLRAEWDYTWMDLLPLLDTNLQDVNLLITGGVRF